MNYGYHDDMDAEFARQRRKHGGKTRAVRLRGPDEIRAGAMSHRWWRTSVFETRFANPFHDDYNRIRPLLSLASQPHIADRIRKKLMALNVTDRRRLARALNIPLSLEDRPLL